MGKKKADKPVAPSTGTEEKPGKGEKLSGLLKQLDTDPLALLVAPQVRIKTLTMSNVCIGI